MQNDNQKNLMFNVGDFVKIVDEYCENSNEKETVFVVTNSHEVTKRCYIRPINGKLAEMPLVPQELVGWEMIEKIQRN